MVGFAPIFGGFGSGGSPGGGGGGGGGGAPEPSAFSNVKFLFDFSQTGSAVPEDSDAARTVNTTTGTLDTGNTLFGKNTIHFNGNRALINDSADVFEMVTGDWAIEGWIRLRAYSSSVATICSVFFDGAGTNAFNWVFGVSNDSGSFSGVPHSLMWLAWVDSPSGGFGGAEVICDGPAVSLNTWTHVAFQRQGNDHYVWVDGQISALVTSAQRPSGDGAKWVNFASTDDQWSGRQANINIGDFRVVNEAYLPSTNFSVPTGPFPRS